jgi:hypothetical protein
MLCGGRPSALWCYERNVQGHEFHALLDITGLGGGLKSTGVCDGVSMLRDSVMVLCEVKVMVELRLNKREGQ